MSSELRALFIPAGERLIDEPARDSVIVLLVTTSVLGPILTERYARRLTGAGPATNNPAEGRIELAIPSA